AEPATVLPVALGDTVRAIAGGARLQIAGDAAVRAALALAGRETRVLQNSGPDAVGVLQAADRHMRVGKKVRAARPLYLRPPDVTLAGKPRGPRPDRG